MLCLMSCDFQFNCISVRVVSVFMLHRSTTLILAPGLYIIS